MNERSAELKLRLWGGILVGLPILVFYAILVRYAVNLPNTDDYDAILGFLNGFVLTHGSGSRFLFFLGSQHMQYKLFFEHVVVLAEYGLTGHINFIFLQQVGNLSVLLSAGVLWLLFHPPTKSLGLRLVLFAPVIFLFFAVGYGEMLDWAMSGLQNAAIFFFALLCIYFLGLDSRNSFVAACVALACAIGTSGGGFFLALPGFLLLWQQRHRARSAIWVLLTVVLALLYSYHFILISMPAMPQRHPLLNIFIFPLVFLGGAAHKAKPAFLLALILVATAGYLTRKRWRLRDAPTFFLAVFILITALGVTLTRHMFGLAAAVTSRYQLYSQLLMALLYMAALHLEIDRRLPPARARLAIRMFAFTTMLFCAVSDFRETRFFDHRSGLIRDHYAAWVHDPGGVSLVPDEEPAMHSEEMNGFRRRAVAAFERSVKMGLYQPPLGDRTRGAGR